jgi:hypothetical protein
MHAVTPSPIRTFRPIITSTAVSTRVAADTPNRRSVKTASGRRWRAMQVHRARHQAYD